MAAVDVSHNRITARRRRDDVHILYISGRISRLVDLKVAAARGAAEKKHILSTT